MNLKNNIQVWKSLLTTSVIMLVVGVGLIIYYTRSCALQECILSDKVMDIGMILSSLGLLFFIVSLIDLAISRRRNLALSSGMQPENISKTTFASIFIGILASILLISIVTLLLSLVFSLR